MTPTPEEVTKLTEICETGYTTYSGIKVTSIKEGYAEGEIEIQEYHLNPRGTIHGGLLYVLTDTIGGLATRTVNGMNAFVPATASSSISYLKPTIAIKKLIAKANVVKFGKRLSVVQIEVFDEKGEHLATSLSNYSNISHLFDR